MAAAIPASCARSTHDGSVPKLTENKNGLRGQRGIEQLRLFADYPVHQANSERATHVRQFGMQRRRRPDSAHADHAQTTGGGHRGGKPSAGNASALTFGTRRPMHRDHDVDSIWLRGREALEDGQDDHRIVDCLQGVPLRRDYDVVAGLAVPHIVTGGEVHMSLQDLQ